MSLLWGLCTAPLSDDRMAHSLTPLKCFLKRYFLIRISPASIDKSKFHIASTLQLAVTSFSALCFSAPCFSSSCCSLSVYLFYVVVFSLCIVCFSPLNHTFHEDMLFRLPHFSSVTENHAQYMVRLINICCMIERHSLCKCTGGK